MPVDQARRRETLLGSSNYEIIRDGTLRQVDLQYPESFTSQVFVRKERHKLDERARRSRLARAVGELQAILTSSDPRPAPKLKSRSAAESIMAAITLIRQLQDEVKRMEGHRCQDSG